MFIKRLPRFEYHAPASLPEALELLSQWGKKAKVFAGGTDLLVSMKKREILPEHLINLKGIPELKGIHYDEKEGLRVGPAVTLAEIEHSKVIKEKICVLWDAVSVMASPQVRTLGTMGGNLSSAVPSADTAPPLIALGASVSLKGIHGERRVRVEDFFKGPGESVLQPDEILTRILIPKPPQRSSGTYLKMMRRNALDLALVGVAVFLRLDLNKQLCKEARIVLGAVAPTPIRAPKAEEILIGKEISEALAKEAGRMASGEARPISDVRASMEYRQTIISILTQRALMKAYHTIRERG
jgi:CO/xanthine dehydrogenase FAD-binding subunit